MPVPTTPTPTTRRPPEWMPTSPGIRTSRTGRPTRRPSIFDDVHTTYWESDVDELANLGEMGQLFATDFNQFADHQHRRRIGHGLPWHGPCAQRGSASARRQQPLSPLLRLASLQRRRVGETGAAVHHVPAPAVGQLGFPEPRALTIVRDLAPAPMRWNPPLASAGITLATGQGTLQIRLNVRPDPFGRTLDLVLKCEVLRESGGTTPVDHAEPAIVDHSRGLPAATSACRTPISSEAFVFDGSAGTIDSDGDGPFKSDNPAVLAHDGRFQEQPHTHTGLPDMPCAAQRHDPGGVGTISSAGLNVTGAGTSFTAELRQGDLIRANGQVRQIATITNNTR